jgi:DNA polymerase-4
MDYFFAQVEELKDPTLKNFPVGIGAKGGRGVLCTSNYVAREYGVRAAMPTKIALRKCPHLKLVPPVFEDYKKISSIVFTLFHQYTHKIEGLSLDEAYLDVTDCELFGNSAYLIAKDIRRKVFEVTGLTCSAGISYNKFFAKLACGINKPNGQFLISPDVSKDFIGDIKVEEVSGVGKVFKETLNKDNIYSLRDIWSFDKWELVDRYGKFGLRLHSFSHGVDDRQVISSRVRKSLSVENTFSEDITLIEVIYEKMEKLYTELLFRLGKLNDKRFGVAFIKIKYSDFTSTTIERQLSTISLEDFVNLFKERFTQRVEPIRLLGMGVKFKTEGISEQLLLPFE